jgi:putative colanic acid biosynthesis acetyltransferase WcaF
MRVVETKPPGTDDTPPRPRLKDFANPEFARGRSRLVEAAWLVMQALFVSSWLPGSAHRRLLLKLFGAKIGRGVILKPGVKVKFPWRLAVGDHSWIGEDVWIDNLAQVTIGADCCLSQGVYLCTGSHDWSKASFDLVASPITIEDGAWVAAKATIAPGVKIGEGAVLGLGGVATGNLQPWTIYLGAPAQALRTRTSRKDTGRKDTERKDMGP